MRFLPIQHLYCFCCSDYVALIVKADGLDLNLLAYLLVQGLHVPKLCFLILSILIVLAFLHEYVNMPEAFWSAGKSGARFAPPSRCGGQRW